MFMYISNINKIDNKQLFSCNEDIAKKLINEYKIPLLSQRDGIFYFSKTNKLIQIVKYSEKKLIKGGEIHEQNN